MDEATSTMDAATKQIPSGSNVLPISSVKPLATSKQLIPTSEQLPAASEQLFSASEPQPTARVKQQEVSQTSQTQQGADMPVATIFRLRYFLALAGVAIFLYLFKRRSRGQLVRGSSLPRKRFTSAV